MPMAEVPGPPLTQRWAAHGLILPLYAATLFTSALLLFWIQPLVAKMMLPLLGGAPAVWNTAMMVFQLLLLAGYGYAHLLTSRVRPARQPWVHGAVVLAALAVLPVAIGDAQPAADASPILWLALRLLASVGLPFFALSASAPLLQSWFARTGHQGADDPYFLYGASNLGSLLALVAFPLLLEPWLTLGAQSRLWMAVYGVMLVLLGACALSVAGGAQVEAPSLPTTPRATVPLRARLHWVALAFVPSSLLLGVTTFITTDVAAAPLLWVVPLALYLLSFVLAFARRPPVRPSLLALGQAVGTSVLVLMFVLPAKPLAATMVLHYATFFITALLCHATLAARRPAAEGLTSFYFCMSLGGALGGIFNALLAPLLFSSSYEYPLMLVLACLLRPAVTRARRGLVDLAAPLALLVGVLALIRFWADLAALSPAALGAAVLAVPAAVFALSGRALRFALAVAAVLAPVVATRSVEGVIYQERSFFGVNRVKLDQESGTVDLMHGTTVHGAEFLDRARWHEPLSYYAREGPIGQLFAAWREVQPGPRQIAVVGLGTGALACYAHPSDGWTFYEIDPAVEHIARDTRFFHYLETCGIGAKVVLGDGRLSLRAASRRYDALILDAFSSDAIPLHLLTREAVQLYFDHVADGGLVVLHISNKHLELAPMVKALARDLGLAERHELYVPPPDAAVSAVSMSEWVVLARREADVAFLGAAPLWTEDGSSRVVRPWTDDFSNILGVMR
jgi:spermidine synthase